MVRRNEEAEGMTQFPFAKKTTVPIENLNARILAVANVNLIAINCDAV